MGVGRARSVHSGSWSGRSRSVDRARGDAGLCRGGALQADYLGADADNAAALRGPGPGRYVRAQSSNDRVAAAGSIRRCCSDSSTQMAKFAAKLLLTHAASLAARAYFEPRRGGNRGGGESARARSRFSHGHGTAQRAEADAAFDALSARVLRSAGSRSTGALSGQRGQPGT